MRDFATLYLDLDSSNRTNDKVAFMVEYFRTASAEDAGWAVYFLTGRRPKRPFASTKFQLWAAETAGINPWLFTECYDAVGDLAETIALILPPPTETNQEGLAWWVQNVLLGLAKEPEENQRRIVQESWQHLTTPERLVFNKLITGAFRVGVSQELVVRALSISSGVPQATLSHRLMGDWTAGSLFFESLLSLDQDSSEDLSRPYPFCLAHPLEGEASSLCDLSEWHVEWKWDGIRAEVIRRGGNTYVWSRGEELITARFPEIAAIGDRLPEGTVIDGEILAWSEGRPLPFAELQKRIGRKTVGAKLLQTVPVTLITFDVLEFRGEDVRAKPLSDRLQILDELKTTGLVEVPMPKTVNDWSELAAIREQARDLRVEGLMLKRKSSVYGVGRKRGDWWKWKLDPFTIDAVLIYAQRGSGKRASLYTDYTFAVWNDERQLVPVAKAYSGLTDAEIKEVDAFVRKNTQDKFGPVRTVTPMLVMELAFEGIQKSSRHKSGIAVRFPRIARWRHDKLPADANTLEEIKRLIPD